MLIDCFPLFILLGYPIQLAMHHTQSASSEVCAHILKTLSKQNHTVLGVGMSAEPLRVESGKPVLRYLFDFGAC